MKSVFAYSVGVVVTLGTMLGLVLLMTVGSIILSPARAEAVQCGDLVNMLAMLQSRHHEQQLFVGDMGGGGTAMLTANSTGTTWTLLIVGPQGKACIAAIGSGWRAGDTPGPPTLGTEG